MKITQVRISGLIIGSALGGWAGELKFGGSWYNDPVTSPGIGRETR